MQIIKNWLRGPRNFTVGKTLYTTFGNNAALKELLAKGETPFCKKMLADELQKLIDGGQKIEIIKEAAPPEVRQMPESTSDKILQALRGEWLPLYQNMIYNRHQLDKEFEEINSAEAIAYRKPLAFEVLNLEQQINQVWAKRDYYLKHGKLPSSTSENPLKGGRGATIPTDPIELANYINTLKRNIRRNRAKSSTNPEHAQLYLEYKNKYKEATGSEYEEKILGTKLAETN